MLISALLFMHVLSILAKHSALFFTLVYTVVEEKLFINSLSGITLNRMASLSRFVSLCLPQVISIDFACHCHLWLAHYGVASKS